MIQYTMFHFNRTNGSEITVVLNLNLEIWGQGHIGGQSSWPTFMHLGVMDILRFDLDFWDKGHGQGQILGWIFLPWATLSIGLKTILLYNNNNLSNINVAILLYRYNFMIY